MPITIFSKGISALLQGAIIESLDMVPGSKTAIELLKENFLYTPAAMATNFQNSYGYALAAITNGLATPKNQHKFWQTLLKTNVNTKFVQRLEQDYLLPFAQQHKLTEEHLAEFRPNVIDQCQQMAKLTIFQADGGEFSQQELASFVTAGETSSMTNLVLELVQKNHFLDEKMIALLQFEELLGNAILFFLHEQLSKQGHFKTTYAALQNEKLLVDTHEIKNDVQSIKDKINELVANGKYDGDGVTQLGQQLKRLQQVEILAQTHYAQFHDFSHNFADWSQLVNVGLDKVQDFLWDIKGDIEEVLAIVKELKKQADLSDRIKPRDELTRYTSDNLELIGKALELKEKLLTSDPRYSQAVIGLGSVVASQGSFKQAEVLFSQVHQQTNNAEERALSAFNLFQLFTRQQSYDKALSYLQEAIQINQKSYALYDVLNYDVQRILGAGGMGCVFLAKHIFQKKMVVIKCFWEIQQGSTDDLFKEAFLMREIAGKYVPQPLERGFVDLARQERGYFISEYIEGAIDGEAWLAEHGKLGVTTGIAVALHVARGLRLAHEKGISHLDLKPANLLLLRQDKRVMVKIIDFGLAKVAHSLGQEISVNRTHTGLSMLVQAAVFGTLDYAPPEQQGKIQYGPPGPKSDMYAFGKTMYRLLTGESTSTFIPKNLPDAPELFELLCDCVCDDPAKRVSLEDFIRRLKELRFSKREWWKQLDDNWKKVFKEAIGIDAEPNNSDLEKIVDLSELDCSNSQISSLEPLCILTELHTLECWGNQICDLEPLNALPNLQKLDCHSNQISNLEPLHYLLYMQELDCRDNQKISDLGPLQALTNLRKLDCGYNQKISDLKPLEALTKLRELDCQSNQISDLKPIQTLISLQELDCCSNQISDLEPLRVLVKLQRLYFRSNQISDLEPLRVLPMLHEISCNHNQITSLEPLTGLVKLLNLHCGGNPISESELEKFNLN